MNYHNYKQSRNLTWELLVENGVSTLPILTTSICAKHGISCNSYMEAQKLLESIGLSEHCNRTDGFAVIIKNQKYIFYNQENSSARCRFTIAHELGHHFLGHTMPSKNYTTHNREPSSNDNEFEMAANVFASRLLAPACVLWGIGAHTAAEISRLCNISIISAQFRLERLNQLYKREQQFIESRGVSCFLMSTLEKQVYEQFKPFIERHRL